MAGSNFGRIVASVLAVCVVVVGIVVAAPALSAQALSATGFNAGDIISDAQFYNGSAMSASDIQAFLTSQEGTCGNANCLENLVTTVANRGVVISPYGNGTRCNAFTGGTLSAAQIIYNAQVACGISAQVILVTLQKEQSLVTSKAPSVGALSAAMGYNCPDTAPCAPTTLGFGNQVYTAALQLITYRVDHVGFQIGVNNILTSPNAGCAAPAVDIVNNATAALYTYTPYQPDGTVLAGPLVPKDGCAAYGNYNFWLYFNTWFGIPIAPGPIQDTYTALGGAASSLGFPAAPVETFLGGGGGTGQQFNGGSIMSSPTAGTFAVMNGLIRDTYFGLGGPSSLLGWPISAVANYTANGGGTAQSFQGGAIVWTPGTGAVVVSGAISTLSISLGGASGILGPPQSAVETFTGGGGGTGQRFLNGSVMSSPTAGTYAIMNGPIRDAYFAAGGPSSSYGWPTAAQVCAGSVCSQQFQGGTLAPSLPSAISTLYSAMGGATGSLGAAQGAVQSFSASGGGVGERFAGGSIMSSPTAGTFALMNGVIRDTYFNSGGPSSVLGWPISAVANFTANGGGTAQSFQGGSIVWTPTAGALVVSGAISTLSVSLGGASGSLGPAQTGVQAFTGGGGGLGQRFLNGSVMSSPSAGTFAVMNGSIRDTYFNAGGPSGVYGWPTAAQVCSGSTCSQVFQGGTIAPPAPDAIQTLYASMGGASGSLGAAQGAEQVFTGAGGGTGERYVGGSIMSSPTAGTFALMNGSIRNTYFGLGGPSGVLGWPTSVVANFTANGGGTAQSFQGGSIVWTSGTGSVVVSGAISTESVSLGGASGVLGPAQSAVESFSGGGGGTGQRFLNGSVMSSPTAGTFAIMNGAIRNAYFGAGGPSGSYGWPTTEQACAASICTQTFQGGTLHN
jgi:uncharacterized protein with LGFP repeats